MEDLMNDLLKSEVTVCSLIERFVGTGFSRLADD